MSLLYIVDWVNFKKTQKNNKITDLERLASILRHKIDDLHRSKPDRSQYSWIACVVRYINMSGIDRFLTGNMRPVTINIDSLSPVKVNGFRVNLDGQGWDDFIMLECSNFLQYMFKGGARVLSYDQFREMNDGVSLSVKTPPRGTTTTSSTVRRQESDFD